MATISHDPVNLSSSYLSLKFYPCSLPNKNDCYPVNQIFGANVDIADNSNLLSPSNYSDPVALHATTYRYLIDITRAKSFRYVLQQTKIIDDRHFFKKPEIKAEFGTFKRISTDTWPRDMTQIYCTTTMIDAGDCEEYFEFVYEMSNEAVLITRRYKKIPVLMGEVGGVLKLLTSVLVIFSFFYPRMIKFFLFQKAFKIKLSTLMEAKKIQKRKGKNFSQKQEKLKKLKRRKENANALENKNQPKFQSDFQLKDFLVDVIDSKTDVVGLVKKMGLVEVLSKASLKQHHKILLPLVVLKEKEPEKGRTWPQMFDDLERFSELGGYPAIKLNNFLSENQLKKQNMKSSAKEALENRRREFSEYKLIYEALKHERPRNTIEGICSDQILGYLSTVFEHE